MIIVYLTCANEEEAKNIGQSLLDAKLVACVRRSPVQTTNWWQGAQEQNGEILLMMESREDKFEAIEWLVHKMHSYEQPALTAVTVSHASKGVAEWIDSSLNPKA